MRITIDADRCQGHTRCSVAAPALFSHREDDGSAFLLVDPVPPEHDQSARLAVRCCPERALTIVDDPTESE